MAAARITKVDFLSVSSDATVHFSNLPAKETSNRVPRFQCGGQHKGEEYQQPWHGQHANMDCVEIPRGGAWGFVNRSLELLTGESERQNSFWNIWILQLITCNGSTVTLGPAQGQGVLEMPSSKGGSPVNSRMKSHGLAHGPWSLGQCRRLRADS